MSGISVKLPVSVSTEDGITTTKTIQEALKQNLTSLMLTNPGERVMDPGFGVGLESFLFERFTDSTYSSLQQKISEQVSAYMPQITIQAFEIDTSSRDENTLHVLIQYIIDPLGTTDVLNLPISNTSNGASASGVATGASSAGTGGRIY
tara:strand:+ start:84 stop:530 length:447 start_codon:yes stop_codon:yes gene_type:complete